MPQPIVFISYTRKDKAKKEALLTHLGTLEREGLIKAWSDDRIGAGEDWEAAINQAITQAKVAILLITAEFLNSKFIMEKEVPALLARREKGELTIFPVIATACPWKNIAWLKKMNVRPKNGRPVWGGDSNLMAEDLATIAEEVLFLVTEKEPGLISSPESSTPNLMPHATPKITLEAPYGTMEPDSRFYIKREADNLCWESLNNPRAATLALQGSRQTGKSSLLHRMRQRADKELDKQTIFVDFQLFPKEYFTDEDKFLSEFCRQINQSLGLSKKIVKEHWDKEGTPISNCTTYLEDWVISHLNAPFILALDEVDRIFSSSFRSNFFGMLRVWHNKRAASHNFAKMTLLLSSSTEPHLFIDNIHQSPFNVAELVRLQDFTAAEVDELYSLHGQPFPKDQLSKLQKLLNGHPFLTRVAFYQLAAHRITFVTLLDQASNDDGPFGEHLNRYYRVISGQPEFKQALARICLDQSQPKEQERILYQLKGLGLIKEIKGQVTFRNELYARYFKERLNAG